MNRKILECKVFTDNYIERYAIERKYYNVRSGNIISTILIGGSITNKIILCSSNIATIEECIIYKGNLFAGIILKNYNGYWFDWPVNFETFLNLRDDCYSNKLFYVDCIRKFLYHVYNYGLK